jgi:hypothetical protein
MTVWYEVETTGARRGCVRDLKTDDHDQAINRMEALVATGKFAWVEPSDGPLFERHHKEVMPCTAS